MKLFPRKRPPLRFTDLLWLPTKTGDLYVTVPKLHAPSVMRVFHWCRPGASGDYWVVLHSDARSADYRVLYIGRDLGIVQTLVNNYLSE